MAAVTQPPLSGWYAERTLLTTSVSRAADLVLEAMGRRSNLILLDGEGRIIDCLVGWTRT